MSGQQWGERYLPPGCPSPSFSRMNFSNRCLGNGNSVYAGAMWVLRQMDKDDDISHLCLHGCRSHVACMAPWHGALPCPHL